MSTLKDFPFIARQFLINNSRINQIVKVKMTLQLVKQSIKSQFDVKPRTVSYIEIAAQIDLNFLLRFGNTIMLQLVLIILACRMASALSSTSNLLPDFQTCGIQEEDRIFGGKVVEVGEFPWMALLEYDTPNGRKFTCGGSLISNRYVLTAAHCIGAIHSGRTLISVRLGEHDLSKKRDCRDERPAFEDCADPPIDVPVEQTITHKEYNSRGHNDIALIRLSKEITFTEYITPICIPPKDFLNQQYAGLTMTVAGWGRTENSTFSNVKLKLEVPVQANNKCFPTYETYGVHLWDSQFCAGGEKGKDSCVGDSGGPIMYKQRNWYATGVVSFGPRKCGTEGLPSVYTKVADYRDWIISNLRL